MIPKNIIQFWHDQSLLPIDAKKAINQLKTSNPDFNHFLFDDDHTVQVLLDSYPSAYLDIYCRNRIAASRCDLARLIFLYEYGGFYIDVSFDFLFSIEYLFDCCNDVVLVQRDQIPKYKHSPEKAHCINSIIGTDKNSPFVARCIEVAFDNLLSDRFPNQVNLMTGPGVLNEVLIEFINDLKIKKYSLKSLSEKKQLICRRYQGFSNSWLKDQEDGILVTEPVIFY